MQLYICKLRCVLKKGLKPDEKLFLISSSPHVQYPPSTVHNSPFTPHPSSLIPVPAMPPHKPPLP